MLPQGNFISFSEFNLICSFYIVVSYAFFLNLEIYHFMFPIFFMNEAN